MDPLAVDPAAIRHDLPFDPTYGYTPEALARIALPPAPADFTAFWQSTRREAMAVPLAIGEEAAEALAGGWTRRVVRFTTLAGIRVGGWLMVPAGTVRAGLVMGHGYGGRGSAPGFDDVRGLPSGTAAFMACMPGFDLSAAADLPNAAERHVVHGIDRREDYLLRACVAALWGATSVLAERVPSCAGRIGYFGGSFGGGLGALALPWEPRWRCARLDVPTFGHHPLRLTCPCNGSGEAVRRLHARRPGITATLGYFDAATAASHAATPAFVVPACFDPAVPPPGQWAVANALKAAEVHAVAAGHWDGPWMAEENRRMEGLWLAFLERHLLEA